MTAHDTAAVLRALDFTPGCGIGPCEHGAVWAIKAYHRGGDLCDVQVLCRAHAAIEQHRLRSLAGAAICDHTQEITHSRAFGLAGVWSP